MLSNVSVSSEFSICTVAAAGAVNVGGVEGQAVAVDEPPRRLLYLLLLPAQEAVVAAAGLTV